MSKRNTIVFVCLFWGMAALSHAQTATPTFASPSCGTLSIIGNNLTTLTDNAGGLTNAPAIRASTFNLSVNATVYSLSVYNATGSAVSMVTAIYDGGAGAVSNLEVQSAAQAVTTGWNTFLVPPTTLTAGPYWLAYEYETSSSAVNYEVAASSSAAVSNLAYTAVASFGPFPENLGVYYGSDVDAIYASYCIANTPTPTLSPTVTLTASITPTPAATGTPTVTETPTITNTPTISPTLDLTLSSTPTSTNSPTITPTPTNTPTASTTPTLVLTPPCGTVNIFGNSSITGTAGGLSTYVPGLRASVFPFGGGMIYSISVYAQNAGGQMSAAIYSGVPGSVGGLMVQSASQTITAGWNTFAIQPTYLGPGDYYLAYMFSTTYRITAGTGTTNQLAYTAADVTYGAFPSAFTAPVSYGAVEDAIYASYCQATATPSNSPTVTMTDTPTLTPPATNTPTVTPTPTISLTPTVTTQATNTPTLTLTVTPTVTVLTDTPTVTVTNSPVPTQTFSPTNTPTPSVTLTSTDTVSPTVSPTVTLTPIYTFTFTNTPTWTLSPTVTPTDSNTPTITSTNTPTVTPSPTDSPTITLTPVFSYTFTNTPTLTPTDTETPTTTAPPTSTPIPSPTETPTFSVTVTPTSTMSPMASLSPTLTPAAPATPVLYPNPFKRNGPLNLQVYFAEPHDYVTVKIFTTAFRKIYQSNQSNVPAGVFTFSFDNFHPSSVANGLYYVVVMTPTDR